MRSCPIKSINMLAASSASLVFHALFCALSARPSIIVNIHLRFASLKMVGTKSTSSVFFRRPATEAMMCLQHLFITQNGFDPELPPPCVFREAVKCHMQVLAETNCTTTDRHVEVPILHTCVRFLLPIVTSAQNSNVIMKKVYSNL